MDYFLSGHFIEACDCTVICPCWVDDEPVGGHCTGLVAWSIDEDEGVIGGTDVTGATVVSVSTHGGWRSDGNQTTTVLYIDTSDCASAGGEENEGQRVDLLVEAFSGKLDGPLEGLAKVSGTVVAHESAHVTVDGDQPEGKWVVTVSSLASTAAEADRHDGTDRGNDSDGGMVLVRADGKPKIFDSDKGSTDPLVLSHTALSRELGVPDHAQEVEAQQGDVLELNVGALPGGNLQVSARSGMRGKFQYSHDSASLPA